MDFNQLVRVWVDTNVDTHFIVSLPRISPVAELRELIKVTHMHCYPDMGDVKIGKLAVLGAEYGYCLADYLYIGQVFNASEGKVTAEVQLPDLSAHSNDRVYLQSQPHNLSTSSGSKKLQLLATDNGNGDNIQGQHCVKLQYAEKANFSVGADICPLLPGTNVPQDQSGISAALEENACLGSREAKFSATQAPSTQASQQLMDSQNAVDSEENAGDTKRSCSQLVMQRIESESATAAAAAMAAGFLNRKKKKKQVKKRAVSLSEGGNGTEIQVEETGDVLEKAWSKKREEFEFHRISELQKNTESIAANDIIKSEEDIVSLVKEKGKNEPQTERQLEHNIKDDASASTPHSSAGLEPKSELSPVGSVSIATGQGKVKEKRKKMKRVLDGALVKTQGETNAAEGDFAVRELQQPDVLVGQNVSIAHNGEQLKHKRRKRKSVDPEASHLSGDTQVGIDSEMARDPSMEIQPEIEMAQKQQFSRKKKAKVLKLQRNNTASGSLDAEAATDSQIPDVTENNLAMDVNLEEEDAAADHRTVRNKVLGVDDASTNVQFAESGCIQVGVIAGKNDQCPSSGNEAHCPEEGAGEDGDKLSLDGSQQGGKEVEVVLTKDRNNTEDCGAGTDNIEVVVLAGLSQTKAGALSEQVKNGPMQVLDSLQGTPWQSEPMLGTKQGRGAPSETSTQEGFFDTMKEVKAAMSQTSSQKKWQVGSAIHDNEEAESLEREELALNDVLRLPSETQAHEQVDELMLGKEMTMQKCKKKSRKHSSYSSTGRSSEGSELRSDSPLALYQDTSFKVPVTQVSNALSDSTTEDIGEEAGLDWRKGGTETEAHDERVDTLHSQLKDSEALGESGNENGSPNKVLSATPAPLKAVRTPLSIVPRIQASGIAENIRQRSLGAAAEIESKFAQFIDSQDGLDEIMDITLSQRKLKSADLANQMASAGAMKLPAAASTRPGNFSVLENVRVNVPPVLGVAPFTLEKHKSAPLMQVPGKLSVGLPTPEFKVPKAMVPSTIAGAGNGNLNSSRSMGLSTNLRMASDVEVSTGFSSKVLLSQELQENSKVNLRKLASENETMNAAMTINKSLQLDSNKPDSRSTLQEKSEANTNKSSEKIVEKRRRLVSKRKEHGLEFMAVNNMEQLVRGETERKKEHGEKRVDVETPAAMPAFSDQRSNGASKTSLLRTGAADKREENSQSQETSLLSGKKRKKSKAKTDKLEIGVKDSDPLLNNALSNIDKATFAEEVMPVNDQEKIAAAETRKLNPQNIITEETSVDRSARETEELYLLMEKANTDLWAQESRNKKKGAGISLSLSSGGFFPANASRTEVDKRQGQIKDDTQLNIAGNRGDGDANKADLESLADPKLGVRLQSSHLVATSGKASDELGDVRQCPNAMEMPGDGVKTTDHGNRDVENGHCQVGGPTLLKHEEMQSDLALFEFDSEDGNTLRLRVGKSADKHGQRQAEHMKEISERPVERVPEDKILRVADPDFVLQKKSRKGSNPKSWTSLRKGALPSAELVGLLEGVETIHDVEHDTNIGTTKAGSNALETLEARKLGTTQSSIAPKKASKSSRSGETGTKKPTVRKLAIVSGPEVCPMGCGKIYSGKTSAWYIHKRECRGAPAD
ncbi:hypothetical protein CY35_15G099300 [Sphagnum magellanicum]|nr:hypothetical protein CY35_15G099300 [Sphagnum magellanicum]